MERRRTLVVTSLVLIFIVLLIIATIVLIVRFFQGRSNPTTSELFPTTTLSSASPVATIAPDGLSVNPNLKTYNGNGFTLQYPNNWGLLTCNNSQNFELDPVNSRDQLNYNCDYAVKPVTILVERNLNCAGTEMNIGGVEVTKQVTQTATGVNYRWCTQTSPALDITHRVSSNGSRATSKEDFSSQVEQMIQTLRFSAGS